MRNINRPLSRPFARLGPAGLVFAAHGAAAMELDTLLPPGLPGLGAPAPLSVIGGAGVGAPSVPIQFGGVTFSPRLGAGVGYDSAPSGSGAGAVTLTMQPSLVVADVPLGFGAYVGGNTSYLPAEVAQNTAGYTVALGEEAVYPAETLSLAGGYARSTESSFGLNLLGLSRPVAYGVGGVSAGDKISAGMFSFAPRVTFIESRFDQFAEQDSSQWRASLEVGFAPGGPGRLMALAQATHALYRDPALDADSYAALVGLDEDATGLWEFRLLAGAAWRLPARGAAELAPVVEAAANWAPGELTSLALTADHEIDDPDQVGPDAYTLTEASLALTHEMHGDFDLSAGLRSSYAAYQGGRAENVVSADGALTWHVSGALALDLAYEFQDRQANFQRAANEHVLSLNAVWTP